MSFLKPIIYVNKISGELLLQEERDIYYMNNDYFVQLKNDDGILLYTLDQIKEKLEVLDFLE